MILARGIVGEVVVGRGVRDARSLDARNFDAGGFLFGILLWPVTTNLYLSAQYLLYLIYQHAFP